jgi:outer membrane protein TolC
MARLMTVLLPVVTLGLALTWTGAQGQQPGEKMPAVLSAKPLKAEAGDDELRKLLKERYNAALEEMQARYAEFQAGRITLDMLHEAAQRVLDSQVALTDKPAEHVRIYEQQLELARDVERATQLHYDAGRKTIAELARARYVRLDVEIKLVVAKRKAKQ